MTETRFDAPPATSLQAFAAYEHLRPRLPRFDRPVTPAMVEHLGAVADRFDAFVFDAYGVLNVGQSPIDGAVRRIEALLAAGKICVVLTNAASYDRAGAIAKFRALGFRFADDAIVSSRQAAEAAIADMPQTRWAVLGLDPYETGPLPFAVHHPGSDPGAFDAAEGFLFLSTLRWSETRQHMLEASLRRRNRPVIVANPDLVAPQEGGLSIEPGYFGHRLVDLGLGTVSFHGKPYPSVYQLAQARFPVLGNGRRVLMLGDTLHTDILGGAAQGWTTGLVTAHGLFKGIDVASPIQTSGITPDLVMPSI